MDRPEQRLTRWLSEGVNRVIRVQGENRSAQSDFSDLLSSLVSLGREAGLTSRFIQECFSQALTRPLASGMGLPASATPAQIAFVSECLFRWSADPEYCDERTGLAVPIKVFGAGVSFASLYVQVLKRWRGSEPPPSQTDCLELLKRTPIVEIRGRSWMVLTRPRFPFIDDVDAGPLSRLEAWADWLRAQREDPDRALADRRSAVARVRCVDPTVLPTAFADFMETVREAIEVNFMMVEEDRRAGFSGGSIATFGGFCALSPLTADTDDRAHTSKE